MLVAAAVVVALVVLFRIRHKRKRLMVAGLDKPAIWREPAPGRIRDRKGELL